MDAFTPQIQDIIKYYVYLYTDPRTGEIFYVGKGKGNRTFSHLKDLADSEKSQRIREIQSEGLEPKIEILVHGLEDEQLCKLRGLTARL